MNQYMEVFIDESKEHLQACSQKLLELEKSPEDLQIVNDIFRAAHTLKGMSATMGYEDLANLTHYMENVLDGIRNEKIKVTSKELDAVFFAVDHLEAMVESIASGGDGKRDVTDAIHMLMQIEKGSEPIQTAAQSETAATTEETYTQTNIYDEYERTIIEQAQEQGFQCYEMTITLRKDCLLKAARVYMVFEVLEKCGEVIKSIPPVEELEEEQFETEFTVTILTKEFPEDLQGKIGKISEIEAVNASFVHTDGFIPIVSQSLNKNEKQLEPLSPAMEQEKSQSKNEEKQRQGAIANKTIRVSIERLDSLMNLFEELVIDRGRLEQISQIIGNPELEETVERMTRISGDLQTIILNMRMMPVENVFNRFPRMVRQLAKDLDKKLDLVIVGAETELDRTVIDEIGDPLVHLLRNAIDHGIETPEIRRKAGKPESGTITLTAYHSGNHVYIEIRDDGAGIKIQNILHQAISKGIISESESEQSYKRTSI